MSEHSPIDDAACATWNSSADAMSVASVSGHSRNSQVAKVCLSRASSQNPNASTMGAEFFGMCFHGYQKCAGANNPGSFGGSVSRASKHAESPNHSCDFPTRVLTSTLHGSTLLSSMSFAQKQH